MAEEKDIIEWIKKLDMSRKKDRRDLNRFFLYCMWKVTKDSVWLKLRENV